MIPKLDPNDHYGRDGDLGVQTCRESGLWEQSRWRREVKVGWILGPIFGQKGPFYCLLGTLNYFFWHSTLGIHFFQTCITKASQNMSVLHSLHIQIGIHINFNKTSFICYNSLFWKWLLNFLHRFACILQTREGTYISDNKRNKIWL